MGFIPKTNTEQKPKEISAKVPAALYGDLEGMAKEAGITLSDVVVQAVEFAVMSYRRTKSRRDNKNKKESGKA